MRCLPPVHFSGGLGNLKSFIPSAANRFIHSQFLMSYASPERDDQSQRPGLSKVTIGEDLHYGNVIRS